MTSWTLEDWLWLVGIIVYEALFIGAMYYGTHTWWISIVGGIVLSIAVPVACSDMVKLLKHMFK